MLKVLNLFGDGEKEGRLVGVWFAYLQDSAENRQGSSLQCEICAAYIEFNLLSRLPPSNSSFGIEMVRPSIALDVSLVVTKNLLPP